METFISIPLLSLTPRDLNATRFSIDRQEKWLSDGGGNKRGLQGALCLYISIVPINYSYQASGSEDNKTKLDSWLMPCPGLLWYI